MEFCELDTSTTDEMYSGEPYAILQCFFVYQVVKLVGGGSVIHGAYPVLLKINNYTLLNQHNANCTVQHCYSIIFGFTLNPGT